MTSWKMSVFIAVLLLKKYTHFLREGGPNPEDGSLPALHSWFSLRSLVFSTQLTSSDIPAHQCERDTWVDQLKDIVAV